MNILLQRGNFNENRSVPSNFMSDIEYSVITIDVIKSFDCTRSVLALNLYPILLTNQPEIFKIIAQ